MLWISWCWLLAFVVWLLSKRTLHRLMSTRPKRSRTGCLCCRRRHKKCDEQKPACKFCLSKGITCEWPKMGAVFVSCNKSRGSITPEKALHDVDVSPPVQVQGEHQFQAQFQFNFGTLKATNGDERSPPAKRIHISRSESDATSPRNSIALPSFTSMERPLVLPTNYNFQAISLPPLKQYHFVPRTEDANRLIDIDLEQKKRLSVGSLLN